MSTPGQRPIGYDPILVDGAGTVIDSLPDAIVLHDLTGRIVHCNGSAAALLGPSAPDVLLADRLGVAPAAFAAAMSGLGQGPAMRTGGSVGGVPVEIESRAAGFEGWVVSVIRPAGAADDLGFRQIVESMPNLVWTCRPEGPCDYLGPQWSAYTGRPDGEQLGYGWLSSVHPDDRERVVREWSEAAGAGLPFDSEFRIRKHDGTYRWFRTRALPVRDGEGRVVRWFGTNTDVDDLRNVEARLRRYELLSQHTRDIILLVSPGDGRILEANEAAVRNYGYTREELLGLTVEALRAPEDLDSLQGQLAAANQGSILFETRHRRKDGSTFPVEVSAVGADVEGVHSVVSVVRNVSRRAETEDALRLSEARFRGALDNIPDMVIIYGGDLRVRYINAAACEVAGGAPEDFVGKRREQCLPVSIRDACLPLLVQALETRRSCAGEVEIDSRRSGRRSLRVAFVPLLDDRGEVREVVSIGHDFTDRKRAEDELRAMALFPLQNPAPVLRVARGGEVIYANPSGARLVESWGCGNGSPLPEFLAAPVRRSLETGEIRRVECRYRDRLFSFSVVPVVEAGHANLYGIDITESRRAEVALAEAAERQALLADVVGRLLASEEPQKIVDELATAVMHRLGCDMFVNYLVDPVRGKLRLNASGGLDQATARAIEWLDYGVAVCECVAMEGHRIIEERVQESTSERTSLIRSLGVQAYACSPLTAGDRTIGTLSFGSRDRATYTAGDLALMESVAQHISIAMERLRAREALRRSEELYRTIARNIPGGGVWVVDPDLRYVLADGPLAAEYGAEGRAMEGRLLAEVLPEPSCGRATARYRKALEGESAGYEDAHDTRVMWTQYVPLTDERGNVNFAMALTLDITERKRLEEQIRQAQKLESIGLLAGGVAHDFNNLLVGILGNASLAEELLPGDHAARPLLAAVAHAGEQAANLTRQMLAYSGKGRFVVELLDLSEVVREILPLARMSLSKRSEVQLELAAALPPIEADRTQVQQVVTNLVINAGEAIGSEPGRIMIATGLRAGADSRPAQVFLEVRDTGCGMDGEVLRRVFEPFFSTKFTGRGLGLAAVHGIMRGHGGGVSAESVPGQGSTFAAWFPASEQGWPVRPQLPATRSEAKGQGTVLVVDDEEVVRDMAAAALRRHGYEVVLARDGWQAIDAMRQHCGCVSAVLLDLSMPGLDGEQTLPFLREICPDVPVMITSGFSEGEAMRVFEGKHIAGFVQKPYTARQLLSKIAEAVGRR